MTMTTEEALTALRDLAPVVGSHDIECKCADCKRHGEAADLIYSDVAADLDDDARVERVREFNRAYAALVASDLSMAARDAAFARIAGTSLATIPGTAAYAICAPDDNRD